jgi:hypothetical protein
MRLATFVLFVVLIALLGLLTVHEEARRVRDGYRAARLLAERDRLRLAALECEARIAALSTPRRLAAWNEQLDLGLAPVRPVAPEALGADASGRDPGGG